MEKDPRQEFIDESFKGCFGCMSIVFFIILTPIFFVALFLVGSTIGLSFYPALLAPVAAAACVWYMNQSAK